jgi:hypothetical protein
MPRKKQVEDAGKAETDNGIVLTPEEQETLEQQVPTTKPGSNPFAQDAPTTDDGIAGLVTVSEDESLDIDGIVVDESHLSIDEKVGRLAQLYRKATKVWLIIGLWVLLNVFSNDLKEARSKNPKKRNAFNDICTHPELPEDLKGDTLGRYVVAAATMKELQGKDVDTASMEYYHFREISKIRDESTRQKVARDVILRSLTVRRPKSL